jgi:hypothetical protein
MAPIVKTALATAIGFPFSQRLWYSLERVRRELPISSQDFLFAVGESPFLFLPLEGLWNALLVTLVAAPMWLMPLTNLARPTSLNVGSSDRSTTDTNCSVPVLNMTAENCDCASRTGNSLSVFSTGGCRYPSLTSQRLVGGVA